MENKPIVIIAPIPSNKGGIARWSAIYSDYLSQTNIPYLFLDTTPKGSDASRTNIFKRFFTSYSVARKIYKNLRINLMNKNVRAVHIASSASLSLFRDKKIIKLCNKYKAPIIYHFHFGTIPALEKENNWEFKTLLSNACKSSYCICIDKKSYSVFKNHTNNSIFIPNPVVTSEITKEKENIILFAGHVRTNKGINELLDAWDHIYKAYPNWNLQIAGPIYSEFEERSKRHENIEKRISFLGNLPFEELQDLMEKSSIFTLPSYFEGCPNVVLEAMSHGDSIVGSNVGGIPDLIEQCGILVEPKNWNALSSALVKYIDSEQLRKEHGAKCKSLIYSKYSDIHICSQYVNLVLDLEKNIEEMSNEANRNLYYHH